MPDVRPRVSVVLPVYNRPVPVRRAIESVLAQTYQDFEIVVIDDASTDNTVEAIHSIRDRRVRYIRHDINRGGSAARNTGIRAGTGELVAFLDSDDEWLPAKLERQVDLFRRQGDQLGLVYTGATRVLPGDRALNVLPRHRGDLSRILLTDNVVGGTSTGMVRRSALEQIGGFDESLPAMQEMDLWLRIAERYRMDFVPGCYVLIHQDADPGRISENLGSRIRARELFFEKHREKLVRAAVVHTFLLESGKLCHRRNGSVPRARQLYVASIRARPISPTAYVFLAVSLLPDFAFDLGIAVKRWYLRPRDRRSSITPPLSTS